MARRLFPHNLEAEAALIGACLLRPEGVGQAIEQGIKPEAFYKPFHASVWSAIESLYSQGETAEAIAVAEELKRQGSHYEKALPDLLKIESETPSMNIDRYVSIVDEHYLLRRVISTANEIAEEGLEIPLDVRGFLDDAESKFFILGQERATDSVLLAQVAALEEVKRLETKRHGLKTGLPDLDRILGGFYNSNLVVLGARPAAGKALSIETPILTSAGWKTMGSLKPGDVVFDERGSTCNILACSPVQFARRCFKVVFDDGSEIIADADHQWFAYDFPAWKSKRERDLLQAKPPRDARFSVDQSSRWIEPRVVTTQQMLDEGLRGPDRKRPNWYLPLSASVEFPEAEVSVDPYILGCWLGDGSSASSSMTIGDEDVGHFQQAFADADYLLRRTLKSGPYEWATCPRDGWGPWNKRPVNPGFRMLTYELRDSGLLRGIKKHIPDAYMMASTKQRLALLQGLMDTDGNVTRTGTEICLANRPLLIQIHELVASLGHKPNKVRYKPVKLPDGRVADAWRFTWVPPENVFRMQRKARVLDSRLTRRTNGRPTRRAIRSIEPVESMPVRCIMVDSPSNLYLAGKSFIPTHNTASALQIARNMAAANTTTLFFSLEMSHEELAQRSLALTGEIPISNLRNDLFEKDWFKIKEGLRTLEGLPLYFDDNPLVTINEMRAKARRTKNLGMIVVDYIQLMTSQKRAETRQNEVAEISRSLKILAREIKVPILALSQLSRNLESRPEKRPNLSDLRESGSIEQDSDVVIFLYRDEIYNPDTPDKGITEFIVAKHRNGPLGKARLAFLPRLAKFAEIAD